MRSIQVLFALVVFVVPLHLFAAVTINEIAWMGSNSSANDEWIELYNDGSDVSVDGWELKSGDGLSIALEGTLSGSSYAVLERTDDGSAPGVAFLTYTGALSNSGTTLTLYRADGSIEDQVAGDDEWNTVGGDNTTKETAQYTQSGWITAEATPGKENRTVSSEPQTAEETEVDTKKDDDEGRDEHITLTLPNVALSLAIAGPEHVYVNREVSFEAESGGISEDILPSVTYSWSFGDGFSKHGKEVTHTFQYPGDYMVTVYGAYARHEALGRKKVTVLPVTLDVSRTERGDVLVQNNAPYELNVSGYTAVGTKRFVFPDHTYMLPRGTITIPQQDIGGTRGTPVAIYDTAFVPVSTKEETEQATVAVQAARPLGTQFAFASEEITEEVTQNPVVLVASTTGPIASRDIRTFLVPILFILLLFILGLSVWTRTRMR